MSRHGNRAFAMFETPWAETYPGLLRANGYFVGHVGKWHNGEFPQEQFDFGRSYMGTHWLKQPDGSQIHITQQNENDAIEFLRTRPAHKPFCLTLAFFATHAEDSNPLQFLPQPGSMEYYKDHVIPVPRTGSDAYFRRLPPFIANEKNEGRHRWHWRFDTSEKYQTMMKNYYRLATEVDAVCGRVLDELRQQDVLDHTLVIFTTDNGYYHGEHGLADKWYPHEESIRTPLIVLDPRLPQANHGQTNDALTLNVDLAPTLLAAAGIAAPPRMQGQDIAPLYLGNPQMAWRTEFFYEHPTVKNIDFIPSSEALVRRDIKYLFWPDFQYEELFNLKTDPEETNDLARSAGQASTLSALRARFAELKQAVR
jgi:arylsulfatase A-like enzyme